MMNEEIDKEVISVFNKRNTIRELKSKAEALNDSFIENKRNLTEYLKNYLKDYTYERIQVRTASLERLDTVFIIEFFDEEEMKRFCQDHPELKSYINCGLCSGAIEIFLEEHNFKEEE